MRKIIALLAGLSLAAVASAQSGPKFSTSGGVGSATSTFIGGEPNGGTYTINGTTGRVSAPIVNLRPGVAPVSPQNGDCWTTVAGLFCRINDATVGPYQSSAGAGTVTQVGLVPPSIFTAGGAVTTSGNLSFSLNSQAANQIFAGPNGSSGTPGFRALVGADIPAINMAGSGNGGVTGTLAIANGGTGGTSASGARSNLGLGTAATANTGTSGSAVPLLNASNTWSATQAISRDGTASSADLIVTSDAGQTARFRIRSSGVDRWTAGKTNAAETGSDAGSNYAITRFNDAGTAVDAPLSISRATGAVTLSTPLALASGGTGGTSASTARTALGLGTAATVNTGTSGSVIGMLNAANTYSAQQSLTAGLSASIAAPDYTATSGYHAYHPIVIGGLDYAAAYAAQQAGLTSTDALTAALKITSGTIHQTNTAAFYMDSSRAKPATGGGDVALYTNAVSSGTDANVFSLNTLASDTAGFSGQHIQNELDFNVFDGRTSVAGLSLVLNSTQTFTGGGGANGYMCRIANSTQWGACYWSYDGATPVAFIVGALGTGNNVYSQDVQFRSRSTGGTDYTASVRSDPNGGLILKPGVAGGAIGFQDFGGGNTGFISTSGLFVSPTGTGGANITSSSSTGTTPLVVQNSSSASATTKTVTTKVQGADTTSAVKDVATDVVTPVDVNWVDSTKAFNIRVADSVTRRLALSAAGVTIDRAVLLPGYTVATLPTCNAGMTGAMAYVTDATAPTYNGALTGGGAVKVPAFCTGSSWTAH